MLSASEQYIKDHGKSKLEDLIKKHDTPTLFLSRKKIREAYKRLYEALKEKVRLHYAVKCNSHQQILRDLNLLGCAFDVSTRRELDLVLIQNASIDKCIHTHPIKKAEEIEYAFQKGIRTFVVDNVDELKKLRRHSNDIHVLFRLAVSNSSVFTDLSKKFGQKDPKKLVELMLQAKEWGFQEMGICFHPGSQCDNSNVIKTALKHCLKIIHKLKQHQVSVTVVDIGGGFPAGPKYTNFDIEAYCAKFYPQIQQLLDQDIHVWAEPGRYLSANCMFLSTKVVGKSIRENKRWYYVDDGVYNSFSGKLFDHANYSFHLFNQTSGKHYPSVIAGPTCDSVDTILDKVKLQKLEIDDPIVFKQMGAYTSESATTFNGFSKTKIVVLKE